MWVPAHTVPSGRGYTMGAREGECWGVGPCTHCAQWEGLYHGCTWGAREVHVRESAGVWVPAHTVPSGRGYTTGARGVHVRCT